LRWPISGRAHRPAARRAASIQLLGKIQERQGLAKDAAEKQLKDWEDRTKYHWD
jgi:hypothetical protein